MHFLCNILYITVCNILYKRWMGSKFLDFFSPPPPTPYPPSLVPPPPPYPYPPSLLPLPAQIRAGFIDVQKSTNQLKFSLQIYRPGNDEVSNSKNKQNKN